MPEYVDQVNQGFRVLLKVLAPYVAQELKKTYKNDWWREGVLNTLKENQSQGIPLAGEWVVLVDSLDIYRCLLLIDNQWQQVFRQKLTIDHRNWVKELTGTRHKVAHIGSADMTEDDAWRAIDTMARLCEHIDAEATEELRGLARTIRYGTDQASTTVPSVAAASIIVPKPFGKSGVLASTPIENLLSWRQIIEPHPDVAKGEYKNAEFAADLNQVAKGGGSIEYRDPVEFFARTYLTEGLKNLMVSALRRVAGKDGDPVIQLKTVFGGGKTHSMLALYHLLRGQVQLARIEEMIRPVLKQAGLTTLVKTHVAVIVGTAIDPSKSRRPAKYPGITINTLWGEIAAQLAESVGDPKIYDIVKEADRKGVSPGSESLRQLFDTCSPCLILVDELVSYAKKLEGRSDLPAGSFDNLIAFIQELSEGVRASKNSLVVASLPESDLEIGGEGGQRALEAIEHTFGRMETIWKPVASNEGFEVVRRRLFLKPRHPDALDAVCRAFSEMYQTNASDFPPEFREVEYLERMKSCYPIHPEVFDRLYGDWATLERFQRTRGVLRLMAAVIHELWMQNDNGLMIMPASFVLDVPAIRNELTRHLPDGWNAVIEREVDGTSSIPYQIDKGNPRFSSKLAARRVTRTILIGSAPSVREQRIRGIETARLLAGVVQPGEGVSVFNDVLGQLRNKLTYLFSDAANNRYWFDTRPTLRKTVDDRAGQYSATDVEHEIENRLRVTCGKEGFVGIHVCPANSLNIPDEQSVRLVILSPAYPHRLNKDDSKARIFCEDAIQMRGTGPRVYRNTLAFVSADGGLLEDLESEVRKFLAWSSVVADAMILNLDHAQEKEAENGRATSDRTVRDRIMETYSWLLVPTQSGTGPIGWSFERIAGGSESISKKAFSRMKQQESVIQNWSPVHLKSEMDKWLWKDKDSLPIRELWKYLTSYCYLPRLLDLGVLMNTITNGLSNKDYFGYADGFDGSRYMGLKLGSGIGLSHDAGMLVKTEAAQRQLDAEVPIHPLPPIIVPPGPGPTPPLPADPKPPLPLPPDPGRWKKRFHASIPLKADLMASRVGKINDEMLQHLANLPGAEVQITMEISIVVKKGIPDKVVSIIRENAKTLKIDYAEFEDE